MHMALFDCHIFEKACYHYKLLLKYKAYVYHKQTVISINKQLEIPRS